MPRKKGTPAKRSGSEKKSQGPTPKKPKVTKVAPQSKAAIKKVVDKGIHNMRYAPIEEVVTGRTELPENYGGEAKPERKSKKPNPLKESTAERIERENQLNRDAYEKKARERAARDRFEARVDSEEVREGSQKKVDKAKARSGKKIRKMSAQGKFSAKVKKYKESKSAKKMSASATPKKVHKPYVKKVEPVRTASGKRWFDITPTSDQTDVGKKPEAKVSSLHKNARIKSLVDLRERTAADMAKGESQRLTAAQRKVANKKRAAELLKAETEKKPTEIKKKGKKMAGRPKKTKASVDAKIAKAEASLAQSAEEAKKTNEAAKKETKPTKKTAKVTVEETKPKTTKKTSTPKKPKTAKVTKPTAPKLQTLAEAKAKAPTPKPAGASTAASKPAAPKPPSNLEKAKSAAKTAEKVIKKVPFGKTALKVGKFAVGTKVGAALTAGTIVAGPLADYLNRTSQKGSVKPGAVGQSRGSVVGWQADKKKGTTTAPWGKPGNAPGTTAAPKKATGGKYRVEHNDTLSGIAAKAGVTLAELRAANPQIKDPKKIFRNTGVNIPKGKKVPAGGYTGPVPYRAPKKK